MKSTALTLVALLLTAESLLGFAEVNDGELFLDTRVSALHDSNIVGSSLGESDFILSVDPTLRWQRERRGTIAASLGMNFNKYDEFGEYDSEDLHTDFSYSFPLTVGSPFSGGINLGYSEQTGVDYYVADRVSTENTNFSVNGRYQTGRRLAWRGELAYQDRNASNYSDTIDKSVEVGVELVELMRQVGVTADYRLRKLKSSGDVGVGRDYDNNSLSLGITGQLLPESQFKKLEAYASVSFQTVNADKAGLGGRDRDVLGYDGRLSWEATPTTNVNLIFQNDVENTIDDEPVESSSISLGVSKQFSRQATGSFNITSRDIGYFGSDRRNDSIGANFSLSYLLNRNWTAGFTLAYEDTDSNEAIFRYDRFTGGVFTNYRF
ncbi:MAG: outer membrane beta-barrel protein [Opitutales bacterium]|jgi:hypothetical protein|nr:outer membrane beta-barrel protein [Opitutales bacterium]